MFLNSDSFEGDSFFNLIFKTIKVIFCCPFIRMSKRFLNEFSTDTTVFQPALNALLKYEYDPQINNTQKLLPDASNQKVNAYLKEVAEICGIETKIAFHVARHTFASTIALDNGIPIDSVSKMLGQRSIKTIQIYAKVNTNKIIADTQRLFQKLLQQ